jgi:hypothetical protein
MMSLQVLELQIKVIRDWKLIVNGVATITSPAFCRLIIETTTV